MHHHDHGGSIDYNASDPAIQASGSERATESLASDDWSYELAMIQNENRIMKERRRFVLIVCADFALVTLTWVLNTVSKGEDFVTDFKEEVDFSKPNFFGSSLFDVALISVTRLIWLLIWYGYIQATHWLPVSMSTAATSLFLIAKVLYYFRGKVGTAPQYIVIIGSLVVAWIELWLSPVKPPKLISRPNHARLPPNSGSSEDEAGQQRRRRRAEMPVYRPYSNSEYLDAAKGAIIQSKLWLTQTHTWAEVRKKPLIKTFPDKTYGKLYYLQLELNASSDRVFRVLHTDVESCKTWNKNVAESKVIFRVDDHTDLQYSMSAPALGGYIKSRDFLDVRRYEVDSASGVIYIGNVSVFSTILPPGAKHKMIRGINGPNLWVITPTSNTTSHVQWIMNTNLKGDIPRRLIERSMTQFLAQFADSLTLVVEKK